MVDGSGGDAAAACALAGGVGGEGGVWRSCG